MKRLLTLLTIISVTASSCATARKSTNYEQKYNTLKKDYNALVDDYNVCVDQEKRCNEILSMSKEDLQRTNALLNEQVKQNNKEKWKYLGIGIGCGGAAAIIIMCAIFVPRR